MTPTYILKSVLNWQTELAAIKQSGRIAEMQDRIDFLHERLAQAARLTDGAIDTSSPIEK